MIRAYTRFIFTALALVLFAACPVSVISATLTAPERTDAGRLQKVASDVPGDWMLYPPDAADFAKDSDEKTLYFVARRDCELTVIFFGVENLKPVITQTTVIIGPAPEPTPGPSPAPVISLTQKDKETAAYALRRVIDGIDAGTIRTPQGARSTFKQEIQKQSCAGGSCQISPELSAALDVWTGQTDFANCETVKASFEKFLKEVE